MVTWQQKLSRIKHMEKKIMKKKRKENSISNLWNKFKEFNVCVDEVPKGMGEMERQKKYLQIVA